MPPKKGLPQQGQPKTGKNGAKAGSDKEFEGVLKQLAEATATKSNPSQKRMSAAERHEAHRIRLAKEQEAQQAALASSIEQRVRQRRMQEFIREMIASGGLNQSPFLDQPKTEVKCSSCAAKPPSNIVAATAAMQGWRRAMEDEHITLPDFIRLASGEVLHLFAVMDGHGGTVAAAKTKILLPVALSRELAGPNAAPSADTFARAFSSVDTALRKLGDDVLSCGCTCVAVLVGSKSIYCGSVGDSRAVVARKQGSPNDVVALSFDHKPENAEEKARIEQAGGHVANNRVNGNLAMSRALGDFGYKQVAGKTEKEQPVISVPEFHSCPRLEDDEFLVIACDGIFDVYSNEALVQLIRQNFAGFQMPPGARYSPQQLEQAAKMVTLAALAPKEDAGSGPSRAEGTDNMSIIIIQL